jgi:catabolite regulation protein CreA
MLQPDIRRGDDYVVIDIHDNDDQQLQSTTTTVTYQHAEYIDEKNNFLYTNNSNNNNNDHDNKNNNSTFFNIKNNGNILKNQKNTFKKVNKSIKMLNKVKESEEEMESLRLSMVNDNLEIRELMESVVNKVSTHSPSPKLAEFTTTSMIKQKESPSSVATSTSPFSSSSFSDSSSSRSESFNQSKNLLSNHESIFQDSKNDNFFLYESYSPKITTSSSSLSLSIDVNHPNGQTFLNLLPKSMNNDSRNNNNYDSKIYLRNLSPPPTHVTGTMTNQRKIYSNDYFFTNHNSPFVNETTDSFIFTDDSQLTNQYNQLNQHQLNQSQDPLLGCFNNNNLNDNYHNNYNYNNNNFYNKSGSLLLPVSSLLPNQSNKQDVSVGTGSDLTFNENVNHYYRQHYDFYSNNNNNNNYSNNNFIINNNFNCNDDKSGENCLNAPLSNVKVPNSSESFKLIEKIQPKKSRTKYSKGQLEILEEAYHNHERYPDSLGIEQICSKLNIAKEKINVKIYKFLSLKIKKSILFSFRFGFKTGEREVKRMERKRIAEIVVAMTPTVMTATVTVSTTTTTTTMK